MSRENFTDRILPTPWYMASFLYRFYNGSSQLKVIPFTPGVIADSYLSFDENTVAQVVSSETLSYGQPLFQQSQQVSNAFEVRTPYYRAIRCDVVDSNQTPLLGDVRTNIRCRNRATFGGTTQASPVYEAAGDDFNFFFMIGPPPMCDIRNVASISTFPTGTPVSINFSGVNTNADVPTNRISYKPVTSTPALPTSDENYFIVNPSVESFNIVLLDTSTVVQKLTDCTLFLTGGVTSIEFAKPANIDDVATQANIVALGTVTMTVGK
jgi:hypothetical protein